MPMPVMDGVGFFQRGDAILEMGIRLPEMTCYFR